MDKIRKTNGSITIKSQNGRTTDNISGAALKGPDAAHLATVPLRDVDIELLQAQYEALQRVTVGMTEEGDLDALTGLVEALGDALPAPQSDETD